MDKYLGKRLEGRYEIQELIGMGGMANVYKAYDSIDQRTVAVKILRDEYLTNTEFLRRFKNESKAVALLSHPNIVRVFDVSFTNRVHSIVMEYIDGITLKDYIEKQKTVSWKESVHFTLQILRALQHAHDKGIVHRDIKPQNIMLLQNGTIKVTDFGIARFARSEVKTITDRAIGSVHYISPEQAMGDNTDEKSDIYSVGVMLFEMLTGTLPFEAENAVSVAIKQIQTEAVRPTQLNPNIPAGLEDITVRAMQKDAKLRYQSAAEMIADIESFKQDPSIHFQYKYLDAGSKRESGKRVRKAINETREEDNMQKRRRKTPYIPILTGVTFAFVLASLGFIALMITLNNPFSQVPDVEVPNLVGMSFDTAVGQYANLEIVQVETVNNDIYGRGVIFDQSPRAGRSVKENTVVEVKVSSGQATVVLQNYEGRDAQQIIQLLTDQGLNPVQRSVNHSTIPSGSVIYTNPGKDTEVPSGTEVEIFVSIGPEDPWSAVPSVLGLTVDNARLVLENSGFLVGNVTFEESEEPADTIIAQDPPAGGQQQEGTMVNLTVSTGIESNFQRVAIPVELPPLDRICQLDAYQDGEQVASEPLNPAEVGVWKPWFSGESTEARIEIYLDGRLLREYILDLQTAMYITQSDYTGEFLE